MLIVDIERGYVLIVNMGIGYVLIVDIEERIDAYSGYRG